MNVTDWPTRPIGDLCVVYDGPHATPKKTASGPVFLGIGCLDRGRLNLADVEHLSESDFGVWTRRVSPEPDDVVFSYETRIGQAARIPDGLRCCLGRRLALLRPDRSEVDPRWLLYAFLGTEFQALLQARTVPGSTVDRIMLTDFPTFPIRVPPLQDQRRIANFLGALDDKIDVNRRMGETLEEIARTLFQSWFVDFHPVRGTATVPEEIRQLFPDRLVDSPIGSIPEGWEVAPLSNLVMVSRDSIDLREHLDELFDHYSLPAFDAGRVPATERGADIKSSKLQVPDGCILLSKLNPRICRVWWPASLGSIRRIASTEFVVTRPRDYFTRSYLFGLFTSTMFRSMFISLVRGTSGSHQRVSVRDLLDIEVLIPPRDIIRRFDAIVAPMFDQLETLIAESKTLAELRDTLLPKLISGELRIRDSYMASPVDSSSAGSMAESCSSTSRP